jgi:hypothetical protein
MRDTRGGRRTSSSRRRRRPQQSPVGNVDRWHSADQDITHDPAAATGSHGQHEDSEDVELLAHRSQSAGKSEDEHTEEIEAGNGRDPVGVAWAASRSDTCPG